MLNGLSETKRNVHARNVGLSDLPAVLDSTSSLTHRDVEENVVSKV